MRNENFNQYLAYAENLLTMYRNDSQMTIEEWKAFCFRYHHRNLDKILDEMKFLYGDIPSYINRYLHMEIEKEVRRFQLHENISCYSR